MPTRYSILTTEDTGFSGNRAPGNARLSPGSRHVIGQREGDQNRQEEEARDDHRTGQLFTRALDVHEEDDDERGFDGCNQQRDYGIEGTEVHEGDGGRGDGQDEQNDANGYVESFRVSGVFVLDGKVVFDVRFGFCHAILESVFKTCCSSTSSVTNGGRLDTATETDKSR